MGEHAARPSGPLTRRLRSAWWPAIFRNQIAGPSIALALAATAFSLATPTFAHPNNLSLVLEQTMVVGTLAVGQTLIVLTAGIDLANNAIMVFGTLVAAHYALNSGSGVVALLLLLSISAALGAASGVLVTLLDLPPFVVTLGLLAAITAGGQLYSGSASYAVSATLLTLPGRSVTLGGTDIDLGVFMWLAVVVFVAYVLVQTAAGRHVYACGDNPEAARRAGINVKRTVVLVYLAAGLLYGLAGWIALGRLPVADPSGYATANLDSITAVVIGGTSLFGGRGSVFGTLFGALIVSVLANGLTQAGIDAYYQEVATGMLIVGAVAVDKFIRRRSR